MSERYIRNVIVDGFSSERQAVLQRAKVLVVGAGGLGSAALSYINAAGVGSIGIVEFDVVSESNLQRQVLYTYDDLGKSKAEQAKKQLQRQNPSTQITIYPFRLTDENSTEIFCDYDIVVDCTDNYTARYIISRACIDANIPMVYGTAQGMSGQVAIFNNDKKYTDLFPNTDTSSDPVGVLSPVPGIVGAIQAMETIKLLTAFGEPLIGKLLVIDTATMTFNTFEL